MNTKLSVKRGSGNVFADLGFERPEEELLKAQLVREIRDILKRRKLTQAKAAELLGLNSRTCRRCSPGAYTNSRSNASCAVCAASTAMS